MASPAERDLGGDATLSTIHILEPEHVIAGTPGRFILLPQADGRTRLLLRGARDDPIRARARSGCSWDPMHFVMEQRMLQGVKERRRPGPRAAGAAGRRASRLGRRGSRLAWTVPDTKQLAPLACGPRWRDGVAVVAYGRCKQLPCRFPRDGDHAPRVPGIRLAVATTVLADCLGVALVLLLASDSYSIFGLLFLLLTATAAGAFRDRLIAPLHRRSLEPVAVPTRA
jgi:hypothetical protein